MKTCLLAVPTYNGLIHADTAVAAWQASRTLATSIYPAGGSLLPVVFNRAFAEAVSEGFDYFAMIHADVGAEAFWLDRLVETLERLRADVVSAVISIKDSSCETSTAWDAGDAGTGRLTYQDIENLPPVFGAEDVRRIYPQTKGLLLNTGLWVAKLRDVPDAPVVDGSSRPEGKLRPWVKQWDGFTLRSGINWATTPPTVSSGSEDYLASRAWASLGMHLYASSELRTWHAGMNVWLSPRSKVNG